jgi:hypothetical protein
LAFFPAELLGRIYGDYGPRLLEKNVRSFLQAKGKVNKGIQGTIRDAPSRFLAYNNGISATAASVKATHITPGVCKLEVLRDFQIVNGGQTTASIYHAIKKDNANVSKVTVQVKLTVVSAAEQVAEFVPKISLYANSQNKVNAADFSANDAWHHRLEALSRSVWTPPASASDKGSHWYYERARGSFMDDKLRAGTPARKKAWELENPLSQKLTKLDVARYENTWAQKPQVVGRGGEKNFLEWTAARQKLGAVVPEQQDFQDLVAKAILCRAAEKLVNAMAMGGYKANVVAYSVAKLAYETSGRIDLAAIWQKQRIGAGLEHALRAIAKDAFEYLRDTAGTKNVTEWAKKPDCWENFREQEIELPDVKAELVKVMPAKAGKAATTNGAEDLGLDGKSWQDLYELVQKVKPQVWDRLAEWGTASGLLVTWQVRQCGNFHKVLERGKKPKFLECKQLLGILGAARSKGFEG